MRILITNDDGIYAEGIKRLALALADAHDVTVAAPDGERSGVGHSFTLFPPLAPRPVEFYGLKAYKLNGTPADCVKLFANNVLQSRPDMVISGINHGSNTGTDVLYSGTAAAALEAAMQGYPAMAVSLCGHSMLHFDTAAAVAVRAARFLWENPLPPGIMLNVNVPDLPLGELKGVKCVRLGEIVQNNGYERRVSPRNMTYYWLPRINRCSVDPDDCCDANAVRDGYAALTPVLTDLTAYSLVEKLNSTGMFDINEC